MRSGGATGGRRPAGALLACAAMVASGLLAACSRAPTPGPPLPMVRAPWLPAVPATHDALSTVLATLSGLGSGRRWSGARELAFAGYLSALARTGPSSTPELFPRAMDTLAYAIDAHIAWTIALGEDARLRSRDVEALRRVRFPLDGGTRTLADLEEQVAGMAPFEPRAALLVNPGWRGGPPLPAVAVQARSLDVQLAAQARACGESTGFWGLDLERKAVSVSSFTGFMWGLPRSQPERTRRLLALVPPPPGLAQAIERTCGASLLRCSVVETPFDTARLVEPAP